MRKKLIINSSSGVINFLVSFLLMIAVIPQIILKLGDEFYGIFSLLFIIGNLQSFINFGFNTSLTRFVAEQGKTEESDIDIIVSSIFLSAIIIILSGFILLNNTAFMKGILRIPQKFLDNELIWLFNLYLISNGILFVCQVPIAVIDAVQKNYINNLLQIFYNLLYWGLILIAINLSSNKIYIGAGALIASLLYFIFSSIYFRKTWGPLNAEFSLSKYSRSLKKQFNYGSKLYVSGIMSFFHEPMTKILISYFWGIKEVGYYDIGLKLKNQIFALFLKIFNPLFPIIACINEKARLRQLLIDSMQKIALLLFPLVPVLIIIIPIVINIWIGYNVEIISHCMIVVTTSYLLFSIPSLPFYQYLVAKGHAEKTIIMQGANVFFNFTLFFILYPFIHFYAAVYSNGISILISFLISMYYQKKYLDIKIFRLKMFIKIVLIFIILLAAAFLSERLMPASKFNIIIVPSVVYFAAYFLYRMFNIIDMNELRAFAKNNIKEIWKSNGQ